MCPDRQLLSVYLDGELPSPWKEKMESHLAQCPACALALENFRRVSLRAPDAGGDNDACEAALARARDRVWRNLEAQAGPRPAASGNIRFWGRRISLPLPAAAAAAVFVFVVFAALWTGRLREQQAAAPVMAAAPEQFAAEPAGTGVVSDMGPGGIVPAANIDEVLRYLGSSDSGDIIILRLPESKNFTSSGEPAIIKAADYSRRNP